MSEGEKGENKSGAKFSLYTVVWSDCKTIYKFVEVWNVGQI